ncbi:MAG: hypothetical protein ABSH02_19975, partial [Candidatus Sulfotelmatobacter sp.]
MSEEQKKRFDVDRTNVGAAHKVVSDLQPPIATLSGHPLLSNRGIPLNLDWVQQVRVNTSAVERR